MSNYKKFWWSTEENWAASGQNQQCGCVPSKDSVSLDIHPVWSESTLSAWRKLGSLATHCAHSEDSDQTGQMPRLIWVFAGRTDYFVGFVMERLSYLLKSIYSVTSHLTRLEWNFNIKLYYSYPFQLNMSPFTNRIFLMLVFKHFHIWTGAWQNQQDDLCTQRRLRSAWAFVQSDQSVCCAL